ncbi:PhzF family phenazine biosynthesis protein [Conyzicola sp.]|uniref:PhzF family phenazine biosynthesis protein n=1 Tax=Conyzicola sp. TaxID=1969404 RepID=UPI003989439B
MTSVLRYTAFASTPDGGNPAGIVLDASALDDTQMQRIAADVGFAETAFLIDPAIDGDARHARVRYFSPIAEVPFCGHATVATAVALARRDGPGTFTFETAVGPIAIDTATVVALPGEGSAAGDQIDAAFTSVEPEVVEIDGEVLDTLLGLLALTRDDLDPRFPPRISFAGNWHPVLVFASRSRFDDFTFDPAAMRALMDDQGWAGTVTTLFAISSHEFEARNLFPVGVITEDPATGSAAASVGGYLRALGLAPERVLINQGAHVGRPSVLTVDIPPSGGIVVSGTAVEIV